MRAPLLLWLIGLGLAVAGCAGSPLPRETAGGRQSHPPEMLPEISEDSLVYAVARAEAYERRGAGIALAALLAGESRARPKCRADLEMARIELMQGRRWLLVGVSEGRWRSEQVADRVARIERSLTSLQRWWAHQPEPPAPPRIAGSYLRERAK